MEIELKYRLKEERKGLEIFEDLKDKSLILDNSICDERLYSVYYDTANGELEKNLAAFRIRKKGKEYEATLKWGGGVSQGLHERKEINLPIENENFKVNPDIGVFKNIEPHIDFLDNVTETLIKTVETDFNRFSWRIQDGGTIMEFCFDRGKIVSGNLMESIMELEIELIRGDKSKLESYGTELANRYGLEPELRSKYKRGLRLKEINNLGGK